MEIITSNFQVVRLEAPEGYFLTRRQVADGVDQQFTRTVFLAQGDTPDNWVLIAKGDVPPKIESEEAVNF